MLKKPGGLFSYPSVFFKLSFALQFQRFEIQSVDADFVGVIDHDGNEIDNRRFIHGPNAGFNANGGTVYT